MLAWNPLSSLGGAAARRQLRGNSSFLMKKGLPLSRQSFFDSGDWQNSVVFCLCALNYFAAVFFCLLMVEIPSMARTTARTTSSTPRMAWT